MPSQPLNKNTTISPREKYNCITVLDIVIVKLSAVAPTLTFIYPIRYTSTLCPTNISHNYTQHVTKHGIVMLYIILSLCIN